MRQTVEATLRIPQEQEGQKGLSCITQGKSPRPSCGSCGQGARINRLSQFASDLSCLLLA